jgi:hypothetical protein
MTGEALKVLDNNTLYKCFDDIEKAIECANEVDDPIHLKPEQ